MQPYASRDELSSLCPTGIEFILQLPASIAIALSGSIETIMTSSLTLI
jgi:hypothetical protein